MISISNYSLHISSDCTIWISQFTKCSNRTIASMKLLYHKSIHKKLDAFNSKNTLIMITDTMRFACSFEWLNHNAVISVVVISIVCFTHEWQHTSILSLPNMKGAVMLTLNVYQELSVWHVVRTNMVTMPRYLNIYQYIPPSIQLPVAYPAKVK